MQQEIVNHIPPVWSPSGKLGGSIGLVAVTKNSEEYTKVKDTFKEMDRDVETVYRYENAFRYGQFLVRQQHLLALNPHTTYYKNFRFVVVDYDNVNNVLKHHLDSRRLGPLTFSSRIPWTNARQMILVVSIVTDSTDESDFTPTRDSDFYIEYAVLCS